MPAVERRQTRHRLRRRRLESRSLPQTFSKPVGLRESSISSSEEVGAHLLGRVLPLLAVLMVLLGAFYPAIDLNASATRREERLLSPEALEAARTLRHHLATAPTTDAMQELLRLMERTENNAELVSQVLTEWRAP